MLNTTTITVEVHIGDEWCEGPSYLRVDIDEQMFQRILKLSELVKEHNLAHTADYDYPEFFVQDENEELVEWDGSTECTQIHVFDKSFQWRGYIKHTDVTFASDEIYIECLKVDMTPFDELPILMESLTLDPAKELLKERLKNGK